jgi:hypothetical protein
MRGLLVIGHNGSYMLHLANNVCSCSMVIYCQHTVFFANMRWVERRSKASADNYWAKILGGVGVQLLVKIAVTACHVAGSYIPK